MFSSKVQNKCYHFRGLSWEEGIHLDGAALTLSSTLRHLSAPHKEATRFSLSSSWLRFCTHSFTVTTRTEHMTIQRPSSYIKVNSCTGHLVYLYTDIYTNEVTSCSPITASHTPTFVYNMVQTSQQPQFFFEPIPGSLGGEREQRLHGKMARLQQATCKSKII